MADTALLVVDMLNAYEHPDAEQLTASVADMVDPLADLITEGRRHEDVDVIYVNDNFGDFTGTWDDIVAKALDGARPDLVKAILPTPDCLRLTKVRHSAFFSTQLDYLLQQLQPERLVITGQVTEQCVLYTALDAYVRHYNVVVPPDAVAHIDADLGKSALTMMQRNMRADLIPAADCLP
ncbi:cysteine hydrolase family protein [Mycolicibacterium diernhoferi]|uniref:Cysteine hydrolase n=1 Tax=Mycolicibacterium diernhoferi TaxID=1801 RepID=A0A1Q4HA60_9MYCO|nr:isochorismatase family cysteine hydrolase [Mycolicibacterium diernhoferi]OJZ64345.1 isochorismatase [Mycolicibacterium diernhoferi]OPE50148.1 isochorismatase [Mycolicibacterium diernhoferi]PEG53456.1 cysteine hydrolase [Mycolicibacterium diernhoferi]QYL24163.1 cysteine hydrolase [Mycolicibacterium diernhoferi]